MLQTVDQTAVHDVVHTSVAAYFLGLSQIAGHDGALIFLGERTAVGGGHIGVAREIVGRRAHATVLHLIARERVALSRIFVGKALGTRELVHAVVGLGRHGVVVYLDDLAVLGADEGGGVVAVGKLLAGLSREFLCPRLTVHRLGIHSHESLHTVAAVYIQHLGDGAQTMGGIYIAPEFLVEVQAPAQTVIGVLLPVHIPELGEVMTIGTLHIEHLAEHSVLRHIEAVELEEVITAVLKHHTVQAGLLAEVDERPYLAQVHGRRHLDGHVLAMLHGILGHNKVVEPVGGDIHQVDVLALAQLLVSVLTVIYICRGHGCGAQNGVAGVSALALMVAEGHHLGAVDMGKAAHGVGTAHAQSYKSHAHHLELGCGES